MTHSTTAGPAEDTAEPPSTTCPYGPELQESWDMRHALFSRWDEGIRYDRAGLFGAKPEAAALECARRLPGETVLDAFCGIGAMAIAFARTGRRVVTVELDPERLEMARHNARVYGVEERIRFIHGDTREVIRETAADAVYFDPPWASPDAWTWDRFTLADYVVPPEELIAASLRRGAHVALSVPPNFDFAELARLSASPPAVQPVRHAEELLYFNVFLPSSGNGNGRRARFPARAGRSGRGAGPATSV
jgi:trimethylguanosine synthase